MPLQLQRSSGATAWATLLMDGHNRAPALQKLSEGETLTILWKTLLPGNGYLMFLCLCIGSSSLCFRMPPSKQSPATVEWYEKCCYDDCMLIHFSLLSISLLRQSVHILIWMRIQSLSRYIISTFHRRCLRGWIWRPSRSTQTHQTMACTKTKALP